MNKLISPGIILALVVVGFLWLRFFHDPAVRRAAEQIRTADSLLIVQQTQDSLNLVSDSLLGEVVDSLTELEDLAVDLEHELTLANQRAVRRVTRVDTILADSTIADSVRDAVNEALDAAQDEVNACILVLNNCKDQNSLLKEQLARDTIAIQSARLANRDLAERVQELLRQGAKTKIRLGAAIGFGAVYSQGQVYAGPGVSVGFQIDFFSFGW
jgi:hypothetical protein